MNILIVIEINWSESRCLTFNLNVLSINTQ